MKFSRPRHILNEDAKANEQCHTIILSLFCPHPFVSAFKVRGFFIFNLTLGFEFDNAGK